MTRILKGEEARRRTAGIDQELDAEAAKMLADAKAEAARTGKEPFDLEKVKKLWVLMRPPSEYPGDEEYAELEFDYYTSDARTIVEFAKRLSDFEYWR